MFSLHTKETDSKLLITDKKNNTSVLKFEWLGKDIEKNPDHTIHNSMLQT